ncbi:hypothetical protein [Vibrio phage V-YDF132]|nr:hypothetical protein [Vibrio phage V-YDF132]
MYVNLDRMKTNQLFRLNRLSFLRMSDVIPQVNESKGMYSKIGLLYPEVQALRFYLLNHLVAERLSQKDRYEPLTDKEELLLDHYIKEVSVTARAMFTYLLLICTREMRHTKSPNQEFTDTFKEKYPSVFNLYLSIQGAGSNGAVQKLLDHGCDTDLVRYCSGMQYAFYNGAFSSGFGGKAWGGIADVLLAFVRGKISAEMMVDQSFHLAHNNGAIFNKGMVFTMYTDLLAIILDVQRGGQIPNLLAKGYAKNQTTKIISHQYLSAVEDLTTLHLVNPEAMPDVDWQKVMELGSKGKYHHLISNAQEEAKAKKKYVKLFAGTELELKEMER